MKKDGPGRHILLCGHEGPWRPTGLGLKSLWQEGGKDSHEVSRGWGYM